MTSCFRYWNICLLPSTLVHNLNRRVKKKKKGPPKYMMENWKSSFRANVIKGDKDDSRPKSGHNVFWTHSIIKIKFYFVSGLNRLKGQDVLLGNIPPGFQASRKPFLRDTELCFSVVSSDSSELFAFSTMLRTPTPILTPCWFGNIAPGPASCPALPRAWSQQSSRRFLFPPE